MGFLFALQICMIVNIRVVHAFVVVIIRQEKGWKWPFLMIFENIRDHFSVGQPIPSFDVPFRSILEKHAPL